MKPAKKKNRPANHSQALADAILSAICSDHSIIGDIKVQVTGGKAILKGVVESQEQKDAVTATVLKIDGISEVENNVFIDWMC